MDNEGRFWVIFTMIICLSVCFFASSMYYFSVKKDTEMARLGYERVAIVGSNYPVWQKAR